MNVGRVLRELRVRAGMTQRDIAEKLSYSEGYLANAENDRRIPSEEFVERFLNCVNATSEGRERLLTAIAEHKQQEKANRKQRWQERMMPPPLTGDGAKPPLTEGDIGQFVGVIRTYTDGTSKFVDADTLREEQEALQQANIYLQAAWANPETRKATLVVLKSLAGQAEVKTEEAQG